MNSFTVNTGYGYFLDTQSRIVSKSVLAIGTHQLKDGYTYVEVADKTALDAIKVYKEIIDTEALVEAKKQNILDTLGITDEQWQTIKTHCLSSNPCYNISILKQLLIIRDLNKTWT